MIFLLDVNALLAMRYKDHVHYERVHTWVSQLVAERGQDQVVFATCPITELGFVRVGSGTAAYAANVDNSRDDLQDLKASRNMLFVPDDLHTPPPGLGAQVGPDNRRLSARASKISRRSSGDAGQVHS